MYEQQNIWMNATEGAKLMGCTRDNLTTLIKVYNEYLDGEAEMRRGRGRGGRQWWITKNGLGIIMSKKGMRRHNNYNVSNTPLIDESDRLKEIRDREQAFKKAVIHKEKKQKKSSGLQSKYLNDPFIKMRMKQIDLEEENKALKRELATLRSVEDPKLPIPLPEKTERMEVNEWIREIAGEGEVYADTWNALYKEFSIRTQTNWSLRAERANQKVLDFIEEQGMMPQLHQLAKIMHQNYFKVKKG